MMNDRAIYTVANALDLPIGDQSVHMIATSPPYWGLRSYDTGDMKHVELGRGKLPRLPGMGEGRRALRRVLRLPYANVGGRNVAGTAR